MAGMGNCACVNPAMRGAGRGQRTATAFSVL
jgi:hypothetical protein